MRNCFLRVSLFTLVVAACADEAPTQAPDVATDGARVYRDEATNRLTAPSAVAANEIVRGFLAPRVGTAADQLTLRSQSPATNGISHVRFEQIVGGLRVHGAYVKAAITDQGELVQVIEKLAPATGLPRAATIQHADALAAAMQEIGYDFATPAQTGAQGHKLSYARGTEFHRAPTVERVAYVDDNGHLRQGFLVETWSQRGNQLDHTLVGGNGKIISIELRTANDAYNVFAIDPGKSTQGIVNGPGGWLGAGSQSTINITGPNAHAYLDRDNNNAADAGGTAVTDGNFTTAANLGVAPTTAGNQAVAVQNLFYLNNRTHDVLSTHGFTPATGNFEGTDPVNAEAQDGGGTDNANFATPSDGSSPRMQMYLWTGSAPTAFATVGGSQYDAYQSSFGPALTTTGTTGALALYTDGTAPANDGCEASATSLTGKIAIVDRGTCNFTIKVRNAQAAGAIAVIIANNDGTAPFAPGGTDRKVKIPSAMVSQAAGQALRQVLGQSTNLRKNTATALQIDGDLDSDIVYHEYGHGLTWRMIGGMSGALAGAIGEGMGDGLAMLINGDDVVGEYAYSNALGIRRYRYANYPLTYGDMNSGEVHNDGEVYGAIVWRLIELFGARRDVLFGYVVDGMSYTPSTPAYEDMRDGILSAVAANPNQAGDRCLVWQAFAHYGVGVGADGVVSRRGTATITESFTLPADCQ